MLLDVHEDWCGSTTAAMTASYIQLFGENPEALNRIQLSTVCKTPEVISRLKPFAAEANFGQGCRPLFLVIRNGACAGFVNGLNVPSISGLVKLWIPAIVKDEEE